MTGVDAVWLSIALGALLIAAFSKPVKQLVGGIFQRDRKGRLVLVLSPVPKKKRNRRRK